MEVDDVRVAEELRQITDLQYKSSIDRRTYFHELFRLQSELIKLQDWVSHTKYKLVVLFEGRDSAGKGGIIKRITQRLNPRICRVVALPAPTERERTQWYFQRYVPASAGRRRDRPVRPLLVQPRRRRAGHGLRHEDEVEQFFHDVPEFERMLVRSGIKLVKYWFSITDEEQQLRFLMRIHDPIKQWKLSPDGPAVAGALGGLHQGQGGDVRAHQHPRGALVDRRGQRQEVRPAQLHPSPARAGPLRRTSRTSRSSCRTEFTPRIRAQGPAPTSSTCPRCTEVDVSAR